MRKMIHKVTGVSSGFTLIELLIVIVIIGIMSGALIAVINPATQQRRAKESVLRANVDKLCVTMMGCAAARSDPATSCITTGASFTYPATVNAAWTTWMGQVGANNPGGPSPSTYTATYAAPTITIAGTTTNQAVTCSYSCTYNTTTGAATPVAISSGANTCIAE